MARLNPETPPVEEEWDPQGLNSLNKEELESFSRDEEEEMKAGQAAIADALPEADPSDDLDRDGLEELEEMEHALLAE